MPTRTQQGDLMTCAYASHGDTRHICLYPADPREAFEFAARAFDLAERFQTPVFVLTDLDIGMNDWMVPKLAWDDSYRPDRGKVLSAEELESTKGFYRYLDVDGDGIPYRTVPGDGGPAFFTRGSGHNDKALYSERADDYTNNLDRLTKKFDTARTLVPKPDVELAAKGGIGIIAYGTTHWALIESRDQLKNEQKIDTSYFRLRGYPFGKELFDFIDAHDRVYVVDQNRDGQMWSLIKLECNPQQVAKLRSIRHYYGLPIDGRSLTTELLKQEGRL
jgi:2-oxoglutarate ferredoxin oxidoreductase subunit alpha